MKNLNFAPILLIILASVLLPPNVWAQNEALNAEKAHIGFDRDGNGVVVGDPPPPLSVQQSAMSRASLSIYPNPCRDQLMVEFNENDPSRKIEIFDLIGNKVLEASVSQQIVFVDVARLNKGFYFMRTGGRAFRFEKN